MNYPEPMVQLTSTFSRIAYSVYLLCDHLLWLARAGFSNISTEKWNQRANKCWLFSVTLNLVRDIYEIKQLLKVCRLKTNQRRATTSLLQLAQEHKDIVIDTLKNSCDILIPLAALGYVKLNPGTVGLLGVISSIAGITTIVNPIYKMCPP